MKSIKLAVCLVAITTTAMGGTLWDALRAKAKEFNDQYAKDRARIEKMAADRGDELKTEISSIETGIALAEEALGEKRKNLAATLGEQRIAEYRLKAFQTRRPIETHSANPQTEAMLKRLEQAREDMKEERTQHYAREIDMWKKKVAFVRAEIAEAYKAIASQHEKLTDKLANLRVAEHVRREFRPTAPLIELIPK